MRLFVISNRVADLDSPDAESFGGLAMAMGRALRQHGGIWLGWSGDTSIDPDEAPRLHNAGNVTLARLDLSPQQVDEYYNGFANRTLWPLCHYQTNLVAYERSFRETYSDVNRAFAKAIQKMLQPDDVIWVHDYHLIPLGRELRALGIQNRIGFFLHIPWPAREVFITLPEHEELVWSMFAYDLVGFQTRSSLHAFRDYVTTELGAVSAANLLVDRFGRKLLAKSYPIGIDPAEFIDLAASDEAQRSYAQLRSGAAGRKLLVGVDRIDYTKGLPHKFAAYAHFLDKSDEYRGDTHLLQIGQPSRDVVEDYQMLGEQLITEAGRINGLYGQLDWTPLQYHTRSYPRDALAGIYRAADIALVTPLRDGMNLVAKEFIAAQDPDDPGVLILSRFAGAAEQLTDALLVNPNSYEQCAEAIIQAIEMPRDQRIRRWRALHDAISRDDLAKWSRIFLADLTVAQPHAQGRVGLLSKSTISAPSLGWQDWHRDTGEDDDSTGPLVSTTS